MQRLRILVILILLSLMPLYSLAVLNEGQYAFRSLDINNGLSQNTVHAILQDKQGFMWFGTKDGLDRYDGISFRTFMKESGTLGNNFITWANMDWDRRRPICLLPTNGKGQAFYSDK